MPKTKITAKEIRRREKKLILSFDVKNLIDLQNRQPEIVERIRALLEVGHSASAVGRVIRDPTQGNPQMWVESKFAESVARALLAEDD
jgi:hypothetical protein